MGRRGKVAAGAQLGGCSTVWEKMMAADPGRMWEVETGGQSQGYVVSWAVVIPTSPDPRGLEALAGSRGNGCCQSFEGRRCLPVTQRIWAPRNPHLGKLFSPFMVALPNLPSLQGYLTDHENSLTKCSLVLTCAR